MDTPNACDDVIRERLASQFSGDAELISRQLFSIKINCGINIILIVEFYQIKTKRSTLR